MSLRRRLLLTLGLSLAGLWLAIAGWMLLELHQEVRHTLDERLASSARMVAGLVADVPPSAWRQTIGPTLSTPPGHDVACQIRSVRGEVLLKTQGDLKPVLGQAQPGFAEQTFKGERWRVYTEIQNGLYITVADRIHERRQLQLGIVLAAVMPFVVALIGSLIMGWWGIRRGLRPLERLRLEIDRRDPETLTPVVVDDAPSELAPVITTLNRLLQRTDDAIRREQHFTDNTAHELRTPLTAIKTHVQLARRVDTAQAGAALENAEAGVERLQHTLEQLLLLARVESGQPWPAVDTSSVADIVRLALADLGEPARLILAGAINDTPLELPRELAVAALRNLLDNALRHTDAGQIVRLNVGATTQSVIFEIRDEGTPDPLPDRQRFDRGQRSTGSGLGLAIVDAIVARFDGRLTLESQQPRGLCAQLQLPTAAAYKT